MKRLFSLAIILWAIVAGIASCASAEVVISDNDTASILIQRGQEALDAGYYEAAIQYFEQAKTRPENDRGYECNAEYEIGRTYYKWGRYAEAEECFKALLAKYDEPDAEALPVEFKKLAEVELQNISKKTGR
ncbi:MAG: hypothetical protein LBM77_05825 [Spirochaetaceae bacterium]|jgi:tetratricopeptide (TPR) repeat protein|nr:hypothetical protein [Spirochaetaceae bacterium]